MLKRFLLFGYDDYAALGGMDDFIADFALIEDFEKDFTSDSLLKTYNYNNFDLYDTKNRKNYNFMYNGSINRGHEHEEWFLSSINCRTTKRKIPYTEMFDFIKNDIKKTEEEKRQCQ